MQPHEDRRAGRKHQAVADPFLDRRGDAENLPSIDYQIDEFPSRGGDVQVIAVDTPIRHGDCRGEEAAGRGQEDCDQGLQGGGGSLKSELIVHSGYEVKAWKARPRKILS